MKNIGRQIVFFGISLGFVSPLWAPAVKRPLEPAYHTYVPGLGGQPLVFDEQDRPQKKTRRLPEVIGPVVECGICSSDEPCPLYSLFSCKTPEGKNFYEHQMCLSCYKNWLNKKTEAVCPYCRAKFDEQRLDLAIPFNAELKTLKFVLEKNKRLSQITRDMMLREIDFQDLFGALTNMLASQNGNGILLHDLVSRQEPIEERIRSISELLEQLKSLYVEKFKLEHAPLTKNWSLEELTNLDLSAFLNNFQLHEKDDITNKLAFFTILQSSLEKVKNHLFDDIEWFIELDDQTNTAKFFYLMKLGKILKKRLCELYSCPIIYHFPAFALDRLEHVFRPYSCVKFMDSELHLEAIVRANYCLTVENLFSILEEWNHEIGPDNDSEITHIMQQTLRHFVYMQHALTNFQTQCPNPRMPLFFKFNDPNQQNYEVGQVTPYFLEQLIARGQGQWQHVITDEFINRVATRLEIDPGAVRSWVMPLLQ